MFLIQIEAHCSFYWAHEEFLLSKVFSECERGSLDELYSFYHFAFSKGSVLSPILQPWRLTQLHSNKQTHSEHMRPEDCHLNFTSHLSPMGSRIHHSARLQMPQQPFSLHHNVLACNISHRSLQFKSSHLKNTDLWHQNWTKGLFHQCHL